MHISTSKKHLYHSLLIWLAPQTHTQNDLTKWSLLRPISDLCASCGLQGPGPRGRTGPPAQSRRSRRTKSAGRKLAGEDPFWHRPLRAQTLLELNRPARRCSHFLPGPEQLRMRRPRQTQNNQERADRAYNYTPLFRGRGGGLLATLPLSLAGFGAQNRSSSLSLAKTGGTLLDWPGGVVRSSFLLSRDLIGRAMVTPLVARRLVEGRRAAPPWTSPTVGQSEAKEAKWRWGWCGVVGVDVGGKINEKKTWPLK